MATTTDGLETPTCRICLESTTTQENPFLKPCRCTGSMENVHADCWAASDTHCNVCKYPGDDVLSRQMWKFLERGLSIRMEHNCSDWSSFLPTLPLLVLEGVAYSRLIGGRRAAMILGWGYAALTTGTIWWYRRALSHISKALWQRLKTKMCAWWSGPTVPSSESVPVHVDDSESLNTGTQSPVA